MNKINEIAATLNQKVEHYRLVAKKYQKAKTVIHCFAVGTGGLSGFRSSAGVASPLLGIGIIASVPLGAITPIFGLSSAAMTVTTKKLETKVKKHQEIVTLTLAKGDTINRLLSKALSDNSVRH